MSAISRMIDKLFGRVEPPPIPDHLTELRYPELEKLWLAARHEGNEAMELRVIRCVSGLIWAGVVTGVVTIDLKKDDDMSRFAKRVLNGV